MRRAGAMLAVALLAGCGLEQDVTNAGGGPGVGAAAPAIHGTLVGGGAFDLASQRGKPVVVDFYASWCGPCQAQQADIDTAAERYAGRAVFVGVDMREGEAAARSYAASHGVPYGSVVDGDGSIAGSYDVPAPPTTVVIDAQGRIVRTFVGGGVTATALAAVIDGLLTGG
jgi:thiol-disulfide isomerase/thioredoxin